MEISIHEVFADLDGIPTSNNRSDGDFNPRGLRRPRPDVRAGVVAIEVISIHEVFADLDNLRQPPPQILPISIHEVFADLDNSCQPTKG